MSGDKFRAYRIVDDNGQVSGRFVELTTDELDPGEVVIRVQCSSINYKDALAATGAGKIIRRFPCIGGVDLAGIVVSSTDNRFRAGDAALATGYDLGVSHDGGYTQFARVPADWLVPIPSGLSAFTAMAIGTAGFTAALAVMRMEANGLTPADGPVIVTGATGGVGSIAVDILSGLGYAVTALTGKASEHELLLQLGAKKILDRNTLTRGSRPLETAMWAGAVDNLGGDWLAWLTRTVKQRGVIASIGLAAGAELHTTVMPFILRGASLLGIDSSATPMPIRQEVWHRLATDLRPRHLSWLAKAIPFDELPGVFTNFLEGRVVGRTVVQIA
ncbi:MAG TPA: oxidoreductase [Burkholderiales bacterium]|nr:oxidoreductase [Burkholderiales bacterium]